MAKVTPHRFGGAWTDQKLDILERYLAAYTTALQHANFKKGYIDAFAIDSQHYLERMTGLMSFTTERRRRTCLATTIPGL